MFKFIAKTYYIYIVSSKGGILYTGMTSDLVKRVYQHKNKLVDGFSKRYGSDRLVYFEETGDVTSAIEREKQIKSWRREKKIALIEKQNPKWQDLSQDWFDEV